MFTRKEKVLVYQYLIFYPKMGKSLGSTTNNVPYPVF